MGKETYLKIKKYLFDAIFPSRYTSYIMQFLWYESLLTQIKINLN